MRTIFKRNSTGLSSEFSFFLTSCHRKVKKLRLSYYSAIAEGRIVGCTPFLRVKKKKQVRPEFERRSPCSFPTTIIITVYKGTQYIYCIYYWLVGWLVIGFSCISTYWVISCRKSFCLLFLLGIIFIFLTKAWTAIDRLSIIWKWNAVSSRQRSCRYCCMDALLGR